MQEINLYVLKNKKLLKNVKTQPSSMKIESVTKFIKKRKVWHFL